MSASALDSKPQGIIHVVSATDEIVAVCLEGDFDMANVAELRVGLEGALAGRNKSLILDLSRATFIDSSILRVLFNEARIAHEGDQTVVLQLGTASLVERALEIVQIERVLPRAHDREEAIRVIQQAKAPISRRGN